VRGYFGWSGDPIYMKTFISQTISDLNFVNNTKVKTNEKYNKEQLDH